MVKFFCNIGKRHTKILTLEVAALVLNSAGMFISETQMYGSGRGFVNELCTSVNSNVLTEVNAGGREAAARQSGIDKGGSKNISYSDYNNIYQSSIHNPTGDKVMLGKYDGGGPTSYITKAGDEYTFFSLGNEWDSIKGRYGFTDDDMFKLFNESFWMMVLMLIKHFISRIILLKIVAF